MMSHKKKMVVNMCGSTYYNLVVQPQYSLTQSPSGRSQSNVTV